MTIAAAADSRGHLSFRGGGAGVAAAFTSPPKRTFPRRARRSSLSFQPMSRMWRNLPGLVAAAPRDDDDGGDGDGMGESAVAVIDLETAAPRDGDDRFRTSEDTDVANGARYFRGDALVRRSRIVEAFDDPSSAPPPSESRAESTPVTEATGETFLGMSFESVALLNLVAVIWGTQHAVIKGVMDDPNSSAASFTLARFGLAALLAAPYTPRISLPWKSSDAAVSSSSLRDGAIIKANGNRGDDCSVSTTDEESRLAWRYGLELGAYMFLGYAFQAVGLETTTASRSGFLLYLNVKLVPFFAWVLLGRRIGVATWVSAFAAFGGTALLALDDARGAAGPALNVGDLWSIAAAAASAMFILRMEKASAEVKESSQLNAASLWTVAAAATVWTVAASYWEQLHRQADLATGIAGGELSYQAGGEGFLSVLLQTSDEVLSTATHHPVALIYLGGVATALANYIQSKGQKNVSAERASILYAMDPVYGAIFANWWLGEELGPVGLFGAGIIAVAAATNAFSNLGTPMPSLSEDDADDDNGCRRKLSPDVEIPGKTRTK